jgi:transcriptional regulator with XRE-family HTH domain
MPGSYVSQNEASKTSPTAKVAEDLALALGLSPSALLAAAAASDLGTASRAVLMKAVDDLERLGLIDTVPPASAQSTHSPHPTSARAARTRSQVQELKARGLTLVEVSRNPGFRGRRFSGIGTEASLVPMVKPGDGLQLNCWSAREQYCPVSCRHIALLAAANPSLAVVALPLDKNRSVIVVALHRPFYITSPCGSVLACPKLLESAQENWRNS